MGDFNETGNIEPLNSAVSSLPIEIALLPLSDEVNHTLLEESRMTYSEVDALQDTTDFPRDLPPPPLSASRQIPRFSLSRL